MLNEMLKSMMVGAIRTIFDPLGSNNGSNESLSIANRNGLSNSIQALIRTNRSKSSVSTVSTTTLEPDNMQIFPSTSNGSDNCSIACNDDAPQQHPNYGVHHLATKWNLWRVVHSDFAQCHCVELVTYNKPPSHVMKILKQLPPSKLRQGAGYALFREEISPRWEDPALREGGSFTHFHDNAKKIAEPQFAVEDIDHFWYRLLKTCLVSMLPPEISQEICGIIIYALPNSATRKLDMVELSASRFHVRPPKQKPGTMKVEIWIRHADNAELLEKNLFARFATQFFFFPNTLTKTKRRS